MLEELKSCFLFLFFIFKEFWAHAVECGVLVAWSEIKPTPLALEAQSLKPWTTREVPGTQVS